MCLRSGCSKGSLCRHLVFWRCELFSALLQELARGSAWDRAPMGGSPPGCGKWVWTPGTLLIWNYNLQLAEGPCEEWCGFVFLHLGPGVREASICPVWVAGSGQAASGEQGPHEGILQWFLGLADVDTWDIRDHLLRPLPAPSLCSVFLAFSNHHSCSATWPTQVAFPPPQTPRGVWLVPIPYRLCTLQSRRGWQVTKILWPNFSQAPAPSTRPICALHCKIQF